jgi:hypothetical protein
MGHGEGLPGWFQEPAVGEDGYSGRIMFGITINRRGMQIGCGSRPGGSGWTHKNRQDQQVTGRTDCAIHCSQLESKVNTGKSIFTWRWGGLRPASNWLVKLIGNCSLARPLVLDAARLKVDPDDSASGISES